MIKINLLVPSLVVALLISMFWSIPIQACGNVGEQPCKADCMWVVRGMCPFCIPWCYRDPPYCQKGLVKKLSGTCQKRVKPVVAQPIKVEPLPANVGLGDGGQLNGLQGYVATIQVDKVTFDTPNSENYAFGEIVEPDGKTEPLTCSKIDEKGHDGKVWKDALLNVTEWKASYPSNILINANWFDVTPPQFVSPHVNRCSNIRGYAVSSKTVLTDNNERDNGNLLDSLLLAATHKTSNTFYKAVIAPNAQIGDYNVPGNAVSGFIILKDGAVQTTPNSNSPNVTFARTAVGLSEDKKTMYVIVEQRGRFFDIKAGLSANQMAKLMEHYGAHTAINLDNSGSSQFAYYVDKKDIQPKYISLKGDVVECDQQLRTPCTAQELRNFDNGDLVNRYRPVPNFLGISVLK